MTLSVKQHPGYEWKAEGYELAAAGRANPLLDFPAPPSAGEAAAVIGALSEEWQAEDVIVDAAWRDGLGPISVKRILEVLNYLAFVGFEKRIADSQIVWPGGLEPLGRQWRKVAATPGGLTEEQRLMIEEQMQGHEEFIQDSVPPMHDTAEERQQERDKEAIARREAAMSRGDAEDLPVRLGGKSWVWADDLSSVTTPGEWHPRKQVQDPDKIYYFDGRNNQRQGQCDCPFSENHGYCKHQHRYDQRQAERKNWVQNQPKPVLKPIEGTPIALSEQEIDKLWT